jgi:regulatory protein
MGLFQLAGLTVNERSKSGSTVAQSWRVSRSNPNRPLKGLDPAALERLALHYVGRYATTRAKLTAYLARKIEERGWDGEGAPPIAALVTRFAELGYVNDRGFAEARAAALARRGYGERRIGIALKMAGISEEDAAPARADARLGAQHAALAFARRKRIGPFAGEMPDRDQRRRLLAAMLRAGHSFEISRRIIEAEPGDEIDDGPQ